MAKIERESINFKLPKPLTTALRAKAKKLNTTATDLVIQGLHHVLDKAYNGVDNITEDLINPLIIRIEALEANRVADSTESSIENRLHHLETQLNYLESRIDKRVENGVDDSSKQRLSLLEQKIEGIALQLAQIEGAIAILGQRQQTSPSRRQPFNYHPPQLELQPFTEENLAKRLAASASTIRNQRDTTSPKEFESWCRQRDPGGMGWRYDQRDKLYHPVK
ncbi:MAG: hypothetical protein DSM106950_10230 [Stigonema ocellatum SAG 48.90 = DSM 106950]|nr:hypothetical protein [Stigonema ocellatum SAG 48.90 = DSM 106950]